MLGVARIGTALLAFARNNDISRLMRPARRFCAVVGLDCASKWSEGEPSTIWYRFWSGNPPRCSDKLQNKWLKEQQRGVNAWNSAEFSDLLKHHTVFGTVHKECQKEHPNNEVASVEAFRVATLMSAGGNVVVTEPAFKGDMADFEGHGVRHITWYTS